MVLKREVMEVRVEEDIVKARQKTRMWAAEIGLTLVEQTKIVTAASEIARNTVVHGGGGDLSLEIIEEQSTRRGLRLTFEDSGPGISDIEVAMRDGFTTGGGMGLGLGGAKRLVSEFSVRSEPGKGTHVSLTRWKA